MGIESPIAGIEDLNIAWPLDSDLQTGTDDHLRLIKEAITDTFAELASSGGVVNADATELNYLQGVTAAIQTQLDNVPVPWVYEAGATFAAVEGSRLLADPPVGGLVVTLPDTPSQGSQITIIDVSGDAQAPDNTITVNRAGTNTITKLTIPPSAGNTSVDWQENSEQWVFVFWTSIWYAWTLDGIN